MSPPWWPNGARRCCTRIWCTRCTWSASPRRSSSCARSRRRPRDLAPRLAALLAEATGTRWTIALSAAPGEATLAEQGSAADAARRSAAADHPLVRAIMEAFPGARIDTVHDAGTDAYGLPAEPTPDAEPFEEMELDE